MGSAWNPDGVAERRTVGDWVFIALIAALAIALVVAIVWYVTRIVGPAADGTFSCSDDQWSVATNMPEDPAVLALASEFSEEQDPEQSCDPDDGTAAADFVFGSELTEWQTVGAAKSEMESNGWSTKGRRYCFTKDSDGSKLWAYFTVGPRDGGGSLLGLSIVTADYCALSNVPNRP